MTDEELKNKCKERAKIFQQAMESCKSSSPMDCIEWFADRIADLEKENAELKEQISTKDILIKELQEQKVYWKESSFDWRHKFFKLDKVKRLIKKDKQLKQAKELLKKVLDLKKVVTKAEQYLLLEEAEQFLKESE